MAHGESWKDRLLWSLGGLLAAVVVMAVAGAVTHLVVKDPKSTVTSSSVPTTSSLTDTTTSTTTTETGKGKDKGSETTTTPTVPGETTSTPSTTLTDPSEIIPPSDSSGK
jgi:hypothetical protein